MKWLSRLAWFGGAALLLAGGPVRAQNGDPGPEALSLGRQLAHKLQADPRQIFAAMSRPMIGLVEQMGVHDPQKAQQVVEGAIMPVLNEHAADLMELNARSYALLLNVADMKAMIAFYDTTAGKDLIRAQPAMAAEQVAMMTQWVRALQPEIARRASEMIKARGWDRS